MGWSQPRADLRRRLTTIMPDNNYRRTSRPGWGWLIACALISPGQGFAAEWLPLNLSGSVGYAYRLLEGTNDQQTTSHQALGSLFANSYIWRPWLGTTDIAMTVAADSSDATSDAGLGDISTDSNIVTGTWNLNMLPQSRSPFNLRYAATDTRVDNTTVDTDAVVLFAGGDSKARKLGLQQGYVFSGGSRVFANYDNNRWYSERSGYYQDQLATLQGEALGKEQRLSVNGRYQEATRSITNERNENTFTDVSHYYFPTRSLRIDSKASASHLDRSFEVPSSTQLGPAVSDITQVSSFFFFRPALGKLTLSGGGRLFSFAGENTGAALSNESQNVSGNLGAFYQFNKNLRLDASVGYSTTESNTLSQNVARQRAGVLYQSDMLLLKGLTYTWWANGAFDNLDDSQEEDMEQTVSTTGSHSVSKVWAMERAGSLRISGSQSLGSIYATLESANTLRLEHNVTTGWTQSAGAGMSLLQLTLTDRRNFGDTEGDQQFVNFQATRNQQLTRRNSLSGNITLQRVLHDFAADTDDAAVSTATARVDFLSNGLFGVPRLTFNSNFLLSRASDDERLDRQEWGNQLGYAIGQLTTGLSHRFIRYDDEQYQLLFFRVDRHF